jgi:mono/diheme cytochrome c family protein
MPTPPSATRPPAGAPSRGRRALRWGARIAGGAAALLVVVGAGVYGASERHAHRRYAAPAHPLRVPTDSASVARGAHLATVRGCVGCHGEGLSGRVEMDDPAVGRLAGPNLTRGGRGARLTDADWERAVRHGVRRDGTPLFIMPAQEHNGMSDEDLGAVVAYARALPPSPNAAPASYAGPVLRTMQAAGKVNLYPAAEIDHRRPHPARVAAEPTAAYGRYLASMCAGCHGPGFGGGPIPGAPPGWKPASNLTPAGIGHYTEADFARALREGVRPGGAPIDSSMPVARITRRMTDVELRALHAYLRTLPARPYGSR